MLKSLYVKKDCWREGSRCSLISFTLAVHTGRLHFPFSLTAVMGYVTGFGQLDVCRIEICHF